MGTPPGGYLTVSSFVSLIYGNLLSQNRPNKGVTAKFVQIKELAPAVLAGAFLFSIVLSIAKCMKLKCHFG